MSIDRDILGDILEIFEIYNAGYVFEEKSYKSLMRAMTSETKICLHAGELLASWLAE